MDKPKWTAQDYRDIAHKSAGPYSAAVHICSVEMLQHAADLLDENTAQAGEIERLKAERDNWKAIAFTSDKTLRSNL